MRITLNGRHILLPSALVLNPLCAALAAGALGKYGFPVHRRQCVAFVKALNRYRKAHPQWVLVEGEDSQGEQFSVQL